MISPPAELARCLQPPQDFDARLAVEVLLRDALQRRASDLHLRPTPHHVEVLLRIDGALFHHHDLPLEIYERLLIGLKNLARVASFRKSVPQDGRLSIDGCEARLSTGPTHFGEKAILRLSRTQEPLPQLEQLGFSPEALQRWLQALAEPQGLVLATGPAGSGKSTTLYASLLWRLASRRAEGCQLNVVTLEDPIERVLPGLTQTQVQAAAGMTFATGLRSLLRQDPDVVLVGEIRDGETAAAAVQSSLSGHLVLSTVHARDSLGVIPRLLEMGVEPYLLSASLSGVIYQRLLRRLCPACGSQGCPACLHTGYSGRLAVAEVLLLSDPLRQGVLDRWPLAQLRQVAESEGMLSLAEDARRRVAQGHTCALEVQRCLGASANPVQKSKQAPNA